MTKSSAEWSAFQIAQSYWSQPYDERTYANVRRAMNVDFKNEKENKKFEDQLSTLGRVHERDGFVQHTVLPNDSLLYLPVVAELEDKLRSQFGLRDVVVVDTTALRLPSLRNGGGPLTGVWEDNHDDLLHKHLGRWAGRILASLVRSGDVVGTGGGRGPYYTARNCFMTDRTAYPKLVASLTGRISAGVWGDARDRDGDFAPRDLDADNVANMLHTVLRTKETTRPVDCSITAGRPPIQTHDVTVAVIGIGALGGGHRLKRLDRLNHLEEVKSHIIKLNQQVNVVEKLLDHMGPFYHCVGDVCNSYFVLGDVKRRIKRGLWNPLEKHVKTVNDLFVNTKPEALTEICQRGAVLAVAGGPHKLGAIADILKQNRLGLPWITHLVTDDGLARRILEEDKGNRIEFA